MFNRLNDEEKAMIKDYIETNAAESEEDWISSISAPLDHILRFWSDAKSEYLGKMFGNQLILEKQVNFTKPRGIAEVDIYNKLLVFREGNFYYHIEKLISKYYYVEWHPNLTDEDYASRERYHSLCSLFTAENLYSNSYCGTDFSVILPFSQKQLKVCKGARTIKVLSKLAKEFGLETMFEQFRLEHSRILNDKEMHGTLSLSIHPLDYMTMSDNYSDWSSCMSWSSIGDYRQGTVEMMNSPCVVVGYLKSDKENLPMGHGAEWNNKKWRCLYIVDPRCIASIRQYPYESNDLNDYCLEWLRDLAQAHGVGEYYDDPVEWSRGNCGKVEIDNKTITMSFDSDYMYNDFRFQHKCFINKTLSNTDGIFINYSGKAECMDCGAEIYHVGDVPFYSLRCADCGEFRVCSHCGRVLADDDDTYWLGDDPYCERCYDRYSVQCDGCGDTYAEEELETVKLYVRNEPTDFYIAICPYCVRNFKNVVADSNPKLYSDEHGVKYCKFEDFADAYDIKHLFGLGQYDYEELLELAKEEIMADP